MQGATAGAMPANRHSSGRTVTLEVTPANAERVAVATRLGHLSLSVIAADAPRRRRRLRTGAVRPATDPITWAGDVSAALQTAPARRREHACAVRRQCGWKGIPFLNAPQNLSGGAARLLLAPPACRAGAAPHPRARCDREHSIASRSRPAAVGSSSLPAPRPICSSPIPRWRRRGRRARPACSCSASPPAAPRRGDGRRRRAGRRYEVTVLPSSADGERQANGARPRRCRATRVRTPRRPHGVGSPAASHARAMPSALATTAQYLRRRQGVVSNRLQVEPAGAGAAARAHRRDVAHADPRSRHQLADSAAISAASPRSAWRRSFRWPI